MLIEFGWLDILRGIVATARLVCCTDICTMLAEPLECFGPVQPSSNEERAVTLRAELWRCKIRWCVDYTKLVGTGGVLSCTLTFLSRVSTLAPRRTSSSMTVVFPWEAAWKSDVLPSCGGTCMAMVKVLVNVGIICVQYVGFCGRAGRAMDLPDQNRLCLRCCCRARCKLHSICLW